MRVLLLDEGFTSGSITARALRRAGCRVDVLAATGGTGTCVSGGGTWSLAPRVGDPRLLEAIDAAVRRGRYDVVYPVTEPLQWLLWDTSPAWEHLVFPRVETAHRVARRDKRRMSELVAEAGVRIPRQAATDTDRRLRDAVDALGLPIVVKGHRGRGGNATFICTSVEEARRATNRIVARGGEAFAQALVVGETCLVGGLFHQGRPLRLYAGVKTLQYPPRTGPAAELISVHDDALVDEALRAFAAASVTGLASVDMVRDEHGAAHFIELNPRPWGSIASALDAGVELYPSLVRLWRSAPPEVRLEYRPGVRTRIFPLYLLARPYWSSERTRGALLPDLRSAISLTRAEPALAGHLAHRLARVALNWTPRGPTVAVRPS